MLSGVITFIKTIFVSLFVVVEFLAFNVLSHTKSEQKVIGNYLSAPKTGFSIRNILIQFVSGVFGL